MSFFFLIEKSLRLAAAIQLFYFLFLILPKIKLSASYKILAIFSASVICYLLTPFSVMYYQKLGILIVAPFLIGAWSCGFLIWIMALSFFDDEFKVTPLHWIILILNQLISFSIAFQYPQEFYQQLYSSVPGLKLVLTFLFPQVFTLLFLGLAIRTTLSGREADLVEQRRVFRGKFIFVCCALVALVVITEISTKIFGLELYPDILTSSVILILTFWMAHLNSKNTPWDLPPLKNITDKNELEKRNELEFALKINNHLSAHKFFLDQEMSVTKLADQLACPEYKLRNYINQTLGFKNFNDFLNQHRIKEACSILEDPTKSDVSIYNLALDSGFGSPVSFNRAFKKFTDTTPSDYRKNAKQKI